jgi:hypothetical protein
MTVSNTTELVGVVIAVELEIDKLGRIRRHAVGGTGVENKGSPAGPNWA